MESYEISKCLWEHSKKPRQQSCDFCFYQNRELFLYYDSMLLPGILDKSKFSSDYSFQLSIVICFMSLWKNMLLRYVACLPGVACPDTCHFFLGLYTLLMWPLLTLRVKQSDVLNKIIYYKRILSTSVIGSILPASTTSRVFTDIYK